MELVKFNQLSKEQLQSIIAEHYIHWHKYNPKLDAVITAYKFLNDYTLDSLPFGIALLDGDEIIGFCVLEKENLHKYPEISPWISDVMIMPKYRGKGYGAKLIEKAEQVLVSLGYNKIYLWTDQAPEFYKKHGYEYLKEVEKNEGGFGQLYYKNF